MTSHDEASGSNQRQLLNVFCLKAKVKWPVSLTLKLTVCYEY